MANDNLKKLIQKYRDEVDDYLGSVIGLYAFAESACWDETNKKRKTTSQYSIPHKFSDGEKDLTPDSAIQTDQDNGIIAEMKKHFNNEKENQFDQIKKYDTDLKGWWTTNGNISSHDLVLLCHLFSSVAAKDAYENWLNQKNLFKRNFAIVEFSYQDSGQKQNFVLRRMDGGKLSDDVHDEALRKTKIITPKVVENLFSKYKFYDADPPLFHTLILIYNYILPLLINQEDFEEINSKGKKSIETDAETIRNMLQDQFMPEDHYMTLPKLRWVVEALNFLVDIKLAAKLNGNKYNIIIGAPSKKDLYEYFVSKLLTSKKLKGKNRAVPGGQQELFNDSNGQ